MTDIKALFSGVGVVIDEKINEETRIPNGIQKIIKSLKDNHIPVLEYDELPDDFVPQFHSISFVILDWNLSDTHPIADATINDNIAFLKELHKFCYVPVFIFSDEEPHDIEVALDTHGFDRSKEPIFIMKKSDVDTADKLFAEITNWLKQTPPAYLLKEWEKAIREAKTEMLWSLTEAHPAWPQILKENIDNDGGDKDFDLLNLLQNNLSYRINPIKLDNEILTHEITGDISKEDLRSILESERFVPNDKLPKHPFAGDIYKIDDNYYINIRPDCDIIREKKDLYLLKGTIIDERKINKRRSSDKISFVQGEFIEKKNCSYVAFVQGKVMRFNYRKLEIMRWTNIKEKRIGRLLPPYISKIQQQYASYLQRQGLPSIPDKAIWG